MFLDLESGRILPNRWTGPLQLLSSFLYQYPGVHEVFQKVVPQISLTHQKSALFIPSKSLLHQIEGIPMRRLILYGIYLKIYTIY